LSGAIAKKFISPVVGSQPDLSAAQKEGPGHCTSSAETYRPELKAAVEKVWPVKNATDGILPDDIVRNCAANFVLEQQECGNGHPSLSAAADAVDKNWSGIHALATAKFKKLLKNSRGFLVLGTDDMVRVVLDKAALMQMAHQVQTASRSSGSASKSNIRDASSSASMSSADLEQLRQLVATLWP
jgi:hypothetical protein